MAAKEEETYNLQPISFVAAAYNITAIPAKGNLFDSANHPR